MKDQLRIKKKVIQVKDHTKKNQIIIEEKTGEIINYYHENGTVHDFQILKNSQILPVLEEKRIKSKYDSEYQVIQKN